MELTLLMHQTPMYERRLNTYPVSQVALPLLTGQQVGKVNKAFPAST